MLNNVNKIKNSACNISRISLTAKNYFVDESVNVLCWMHHPAILFVTCLRAILRGKNLAHKIQTMIKIDIIIVYITVDLPRPT